MDPTEIIKAVPDLAKGLAAVGTAIPFTRIVKKMLGPATDELAEMWKDRVRFYRYQNQMQCVKKAEQMAQKAGFTPQTVPPKILFPLLEGVSLEDNDHLHTMWAALLANAASPTDSSTVRPGFIALLKEMCGDEATILKFVFDSVHKSVSKNWQKHSVSLEEIKEMYEKEFRPASGDDITFYTALDSLEAAELIRTSNLGTAWGLTSRGYHFIMSCSPPKGASQ